MEENHIRSATGLLWTKGSSHLKETGRTWAHICRIQYKTRVETVAGRQIARSHIHKRYWQIKCKHTHIHAVAIMAGQSLEAKIVVLGSQGVGKTSLVARYVKNQFNPATTVSTVGASFLTKRVVDEDSDTTVRLQIWDTAGQERFRYVMLPVSHGFVEVKMLIFAGAVQ